MNNLKLTKELELLKAQYYAEIEPFQKTIIYWAKHQAKPFTMNDAKKELPQTFKAMDLIKKHYEKKIQGKL